MKFFLQSCINIFLTLSFGSSVPIDVNKRTTKAGVYWVTRGMDRCLVGFLPDKYLLHKNVLHGRLAQIEEIYTNSKKRHKKQYSECHEGVCYAILVDAPRNGDRGVNEHLFIVDSSTDDDEF